MIDKQQIEEAADNLKRKLFNSKLISLPNNGGDTFSAEEVIRYITGIESLLKELSQPKDVEGIRNEFFNSASGNVFDFSVFGELLEQSTKDNIWSFFLPYLQPQQSDAVEFAMYICDKNVPYYDIEDFKKRYEELYQQFKETRK